MTSETALEGAATKCKLGGKALAGSREAKPEPATAGASVIAKWLKSDIGLDGAVVAAHCWPVAPWR